MVWMAIKYDGRMLMRWCESPMDGKAYTKMLSERVVLRWIKEPGYTYMHDGATCHTSKHTRAFLTQKRVHVLSPWPAQSPDLNLVEHVWAAMARWMIGKSFASVSALWDGVCAAADALDPVLIPNLYSGVNRRFDAVVAAKGGHTKY